ncbi:MAG TPA: polysaccharide deacetylase family protein [Armatimonadota bacterium]|jgi:peptidoglycan/xylan/chitin deacetylase (PgdA/CDA1 family)
MITILVYHQIGRFGRVAAHRAVYCDAGAFRRQMAFLRAGRYSVLSLADVLACVRGERPIPPRAVHLSFDDGYLNFAAEAVPAMRRFGYPSSVYMVSGLIGKDAEWLPAAGLPVAPLMDGDTLRAVETHRAVVGSHTVNHVRLSQLTGDALHRELTESRATLEETLGHPVTAFCYPFGDLNAETVSAVRAAGYDTALTCRRDRATKGTDPLLLPRHAVSYGTSLVGLFWKLHFQKPKAA